MTAQARKIRTTLQAISHLTIAAQIRLTPTLNALTTELDCYDGYKTDCRPKPFPTGKGSPTSSVEHAALGPDERNDTDTYAKGPRAVMAEIQDFLDAAVLALETVCRECDKRTPGLTDIDISRLRCATIPKGACTQWADPTRTDGMCIDHGRTIDTNRRRLTRHKAGAA